MRKNKPNKFVIIGILYFLILLTISTAYSFFNEDLSINASASIDNTNINNNYEHSASLQNSWQEGNIYNYKFVSTLSYLGTEETTGWKIYIKVPMDTEIIGCWNTESCDVEGEVLTINSAQYNSVLSPENSSASYSLQLKTSKADYELEVIGVSFTTSSNNPDTPGDGDNDDNNNDNITTVDYVDAILKITGGWSNTSTYILNVKNNSDSVTISSWSATITFPQGTTVSSLWGGSYNYDESTGILTLHGPDWSPSLSPSGNTEVNFYMDTGITAPYTPEIGSFIGTCSTGEKIKSNITIEQSGGNS